MKAKKIVAVLVVMLFAVSAVAFADCGCNTCAKSSPCNTCAKAKPCNTCSQSRPCSTCGNPCNTCCDKVALAYKRDVIGNKVPTQTYNGGTNHDTATKYENTIVTGE